MEKDYKELDLDKLANHILEQELKNTLDLRLVREANSYLKCGIIDIRGYQSIVGRLMNLKNKQDIA